MSREIYDIEFKKQIVREYEQENIGYRKLAQRYKLDRDTVRNWVLNPRLHETDSGVTVSPKESFRHPIKDLDYYRETAAYWENYAHQLEAEIVRTRQVLAAYLPEKLADGLRQDIFSSLSMRFYGRYAEYDSFVNDFHSGIDPMESDEQVAHMLRLRAGTDETTYLHLLPPKK